MQGFKKHRKKHKHIAELSKKVHFMQNANVSKNWNNYKIIEK